MKRFFIKQNLDKDFELQASEHHHLANVLRAQVGEQIIGCNGDQYDYYFEIAGITKQATRLRFIKREQNKSNPHVHAAVFLAAIKQDNLSLVTQKLNEMGVSELVLFNADRCNASPKSINLDKLNTIARQSCKQCGRSIPLIVQFTPEQPDVALASYDTVILADESNTKISLLSKITPVGRTALIIGPEGGFTPKERDKLYALPDIQPASLGPRILRAETAAIAASAIIMSKLGEM